MHIRKALAYTVISSLLNAQIIYPLQANPIEIEIMRKVGTRTALLPTYLLHEMLWEEMPVPSSSTQSLQEFLEQEPEKWQTRIDNKSWGGIFIGSLLTTLNVKPEQLYVSSQTNNLLKLELRDHHRNFTPPFVQIKGGERDSEHYLLARNPMYLMDEFLRLPVNPQLVQKIKGLFAEEFVLKWLGHLQKCNEVYEQQRQDGTLSVVDYLEYELPICLFPGTALKLIENLKKLQHTLKPNQSYGELFQAFSPITYRFYQRQHTGRDDLQAINHFEALWTEEGTPSLTVEAVLKPELDQPLFRNSKKHVYEALREITLSNQYETQFISQAALEFIEGCRLENYSAVQQQKLLEVIAQHFPQQTVKAANSQWHITSILGKFLHESISPAALGLIIDLGVDPHFQQAEKTPLQTSIERFEQNPAEAPQELDRMAMLVRKGANADQDLEGNTLLDEVMQNRSLGLFLHLVNLGAGTKANYKTTLHWYRYLKQNGLMDEHTRRAFHKLRLANNEIHWHLGLEEVLPPYQEATTDKVLSLFKDIPKLEVHFGTLDGLIKIAPEMFFSAAKKCIETYAPEILSQLEPAHKLKGALIGERVIPEEVYQQLWDENQKDEEGKPCFKGVNKHGRRDVGRATLNGHTVYFKRLPELPGFEHAVGFLFHKLIGHGTCHTDLVRINDEPFLISSGIEGPNLQELFSESKGQTPSQFSQLEPQKLSALILMTMLTNPEDGKPDNYVLKKIFSLTGAIQYEIVGIDNDHSFSSTIPTEVIDENGDKRIVQTKSVLYCLDQMKGPVHPQVRKFFKTIDAYKLLKEWLEDLSYTNEAYNTLFTTKEADKWFKQVNPTLIGIPFKTGMLTHLYDNILKLQEALSSKKEMTHLELLARLEPRLAKRYGPFLLSEISVQQRFYKADGHHYQKTASGAYATINSSTLLLKTLNLLNQDVDLIASMRQTGFLSPNTALNRLQKLLEQKQAETLKNKDVQAFIALRTDHQRSNFLKDFDFRDLKPVAQQTILHVLDTADPHRLSLKNCETLTDDWLSRLIERGNIINLNLKGCKSLTDKALKFILDKCSHLRRLVLSQTPITVLQEIHHPYLEILNFNHSTAIKQLKLNLPNLKKLHAAFLPQLENISFISPSNQLFHLNIQEDKLLTDSVVDDIISVSPKLQKINAKGCTRITLPEFLELQPRYSRALLKDAPEGYRFLIETTLSQNNSALLKEINLSRISFGNHPWFIESLTQALPFHPFLTSLDLRYNQIDEGGATALAKILTATTLNQLVLRGNKIGAGGAAPLAAALHNNLALNYLDLSGNYIGDEGTNYIATALHNNTTLNQLYLGYNNIGVEGANYIATALCNNTTLNQLYLNNNKIGTEGAKYIATTLHNNTTLNQLYLGYNNIGDAGTKYIATALHNNTTLNQLYLGYNNIGVEGVNHIATALHNNTTLNQLVLRGNKIGVEGVNHIATALQNNTTLNQLDLSNNKIGDEGAKYIATALQNNTTLNQLDLSNNWMDDGGTKCIATALHHNTVLNQLDLSCNKIGDEGAKYIATALQNNTTLNQLYLNINKIGVEGANHIATALHHNTTLNQLYLSNNKIGNGGAKYIATALHNNTTLNQLYLGYNNIGVEGVNHIATALQNNTTLNQLYLGYNKIGVEGANHIATALHNNTTLNHLDLSDNNISAVGATHIATILQNNTTLNHLDLSDNNMGDGGAIYIVTVLQNNTTLSQLELRGNNISEETQNKIKDRLLLNRIKRLVTPEEEKSKSLSPVILPLYGSSHNNRYNFRIPESQSTGTVFEKMGLDRYQAVRQLLALKHDKAIREKFFPNILEMFRHELSLNVLTPSLLTGLNKTINELKQHRGITGTLCDNPLALKTQIAAQVWTDELTRQHLKTLDALLEEAKTCCTTPQTYRTYIINSLGREGKISNNPLNHFILDKLADLNDIQLNIWKQPLQGERLTLVRSTHPSLVKSTLHLLQTYKPPYYKLLETTNNGNDVVAQPQLPSLENWQNVEAISLATKDTQEEATQQSMQKVIPKVNYYGQSIDGGGIRGLIPATMMVLLEQEVREYTKQYKYLYQLFDYIGGTSIGGILSLASVASEDGINPILPIEQFPTLFTERGKDIFKKGKWDYGISKAKFKAEPLEEVLAQYLKEVPLSKSLTNIIVPAVSHAQAPLKGFAFDSQNARQNINLDFLMRDVGRATSAAPTYFPEAIFTNITGTQRYRFSDGGTWQNNPSSLIYDQIVRTYEDANRTNVNIFSFGTGIGKSDYSAPSGDGVLHWTKTLLFGQMDLSLDAVNQRMENLLGSNYHRLQPIIADDKGELLAADLADVSPSLLEKYQDIATSCFKDYKKNFVEQHKGKEFVRQLIEHRAERHPAQLATE